MSFPEFCHNKNYPLVISGYTIDSHLGDYYKKASQRLSKSLIRFNIPHIIYPLQGVQHLGRHKSWVTGCSFKVKLIQQTMRLFKHPVLWLDADAEVLKEPLIFKNPPFDAGLCSAGGGHILTGTAYFNVKSKPMVDLWAKRIKETPSTPDETILLHIWNNMNKKIKLKILPSSYNVDVYSGTNTANVIIAQYLRPDVAASRGVKPIKP